MDCHLKCHTKLSPLLCMAGTTGLEPATSAVTVGDKTRNLLKTGGNGWPFQRPEEPKRTVFVPILCPCLFRGPTSQTALVLVRKSEHVANIHIAEVKETENAQLTNKDKAGLSLKVSEKGAVSLYGMGRVGGGKSAGARACNG